ncbi:SWR1 complex subunit vps71 [Pleurostoma richardsiae]|uniref:SWR1 complex subunit vps71 n=1 Tax=Pleurostoma richardsiae TaxID=41990 RepID=A0AA38S7N4_9PEZI|nr:SWR1 complex subunit vps71 [Pleurostoma richardsiae]
MNNFGVIEVASTRTTHAPGWAYVPDTTGVPHQQQLTSRKRGARGQGAALSLSDVSARHDARVQKEIELLSRDSHREANIPVPPKAGGTRAQGKHTPNVRKILASQKTFANHLDDYEALLAQESSGTTGHPNQYTASRAAAAAAAQPTPPPAASSSSSSKRSAAAGAHTRAPPPPTTPLKTEDASNDDVPMPDAPSAAAPAAQPPPPSIILAGPRSTILTPYANAPPPLPGDGDPLLESWVPPPPTDDELRALVAAPPLSYDQARGVWGQQGEGGGGGPRRRRYFCEVCGYWGRVRCMKCGTRVCALDCLEVHREECVTRYGL